MHRLRGCVRPKHGGFPAAAAGLAVLGVLLLASTLVPTAGASPAWGPGTASWANGSVLCQFSIALPFASVSREGANGTGLTLGLGGISEIDANGSVVAVANLSGAVWGSANASRDEMYDFSFGTNASLSSPRGGSGPWGTAGIRVDYDLPDGDTVSGIDRDTVTVHLTVQNWTWQSTGDLLKATFAAWPMHPSEDHLSRSEVAGWLLADRSNATGLELERVKANTSAIAGTGDGPRPIAATPVLELSSPSSARVSVAFGPSAGEYESVAYALQIGVVRPLPPSPVPWTEVGMVLGGAVATSLGIAAVTRRLRARTSRLTYVDEDER